MPSPFPGMDPYLEASWSAVHVFMIAGVAARLNRSLPAGLRARPEESVRVESIVGGSREPAYGYATDVGVVPDPRTASGAPPSWLFRSRSSFPTSGKPWSTEACRSSMSNRGAAS